MKTQDPSILEVNKTRVMADRKNRMPEFSFASPECGFEASSQGLVGSSDLRNVNSRSGIGHAGPRRDYSFSPVNRSEAITYRLLLSSIRPFGRSRGLGVGCP